MATRNERRIRVTRARTAAVTAILLAVGMVAAGSAQTSPGKPSAQASPRVIASVKALAEGLACTVDYFNVAECPAFLIRPKAKPAASPMPWVWYAPVIGHPNTDHAWMLRQWLDKGIGMAGVDVGESFGSPRGRRVYAALWEALTSRYGMSERPCLLPQSRGGLMLYNWAAENPASVACIAGIYTVCDLRSYPGLDQACGAYGLTAAELHSRLAEHNPIERLAPLAKAGVPILHVHGDADAVVPLEKNSGELARRYCAMGGPVRLIVIPGKGHQVCREFFECQELVDFVAAEASRSGSRKGLTFFGWSDQHVAVSGEANHLLPAIDAMNGLPGTKYPAQIGGTVDEPSFVLGCGDITEWPTHAAKNRYEELITRRLRFPSFDLAGNHDEGGKSPSETIMKWIIARHGALSYTFDRGGVHFIVLFSKYDDRLERPEQPVSKEALAFLRNDLAQVVKGAPVVVALHLCFDAITNREEFVSALGDANVLMIVSGHYHKSKVDHFRGIPFVQLPSPVPNGSHEVTVVRISPDRLIAVPYHYETKKWSAGRDKVLDVPLRAGMRRQEQPAQAAR